MLTIHIKQYQLLISKCEIAALKHYYYSKAFIECLNDMDDIYESIEEQI